MSYIQPVLLIVIGGIFAIGGLYIFWGTMRTKEIMDTRERRGNMVGSLFLLTIGMVLLLWGGLIWHSQQTAQRGLENNKPSTQKEIPSIFPSQTNQDKPQEQPPFTSEQIQQQQSVKKQEAEKAVKSFNLLQKNFDIIVGSHQTEISDINKGTIELTGSYDVDKLTQQTQTLFKDVQAMEVAPQYNRYKELMLDSVLYLQSSIEDLKICIVDKKFNMFAESQDFLQKAMEINKITNIGIKNQAAIDGYSIEN